MTQMGVVMERETESTAPATEWEWVQGFGWVERKVTMAEVVEMPRPEQDDERKRA